MSFMTPSELACLGLKHCGHNVLISTSARIYFPSGLSINDFSRIDDNCVVSGLVSIGRNVHIAAGTVVSGGKAGIVFDDFSGLAYGCCVFAQSDDYAGTYMTNPTIPLAYRSEAAQPVHLSRHVIIGAHSVVFPGVTLGEGSAVGAMSLVTKDTKPWGIYFGVPAKRIKTRRRCLLDLERNYLESQ